MTDEKANNLAVGSSLGHYRITKKIGAGGMGEVYLAEDSRLRRKIALKVLPENIAQDKERLQRFEQEAFAASALNHPNILTIYEFGAENGVHFLAAEFVEGETLRARLQNKSLTISEALDISAQTASALVAAHEAGIIHRDIKAENIMIRRDHLVKVLDFGLAKLTANKSIVDNEGETKAQVKTATGVIMGTAAYMSPEQARGIETDARTDVFSLGVVIYEMIAGRLPFAGETTSDTIAAILKNEPAPLARFAPDVPRQLERIVGKALRKDREDRYQHIKDLLIDVRDLKQELEFEAKMERGKFGVSPSNSNSETRETQILEAETTAENIAPESKTANLSSAEYIAGEIKNHKLGLIVFSVLMLAAIGFGYRFFFNHSSNAKQIESIAVLPFENGSGDANLDYLSDGLSESLIDKLSQLPQLKVIARSSSFKYRGANIDVQDAANKLGVQAIVMGKVVRVGDNLTVRVEMIDASENRQLWSEQYNRKAADLISVQQEIAQTASEKLRLRLSGAQEQQFAKRETINPQAYELLLRGNYHFNKGIIEDWKKANEYYQQAVAADPNYALAYARLSFSYHVLAGSSIIDPKEFMPKAEAAARRALELDKNLPDARLVLANLRMNAWDWEAAEAEFKRAVELNPNLGDAHREYSFYLCRLGRHDEAIAEAIRAKELDPLNLITNAHVGYALYFARRYDESIEAFQKTLEIDPNYAMVYNFIGYDYAGKRMYQEAITNYLKANRLGIEGSSFFIYLGASYALAGERGKAQEILKQLQTGKEYVSPGELAVLYVALGDKEKAFQLLEKAYVEHDLQLIFLKVDPSFDPLRDDPRYADLIRRVGIPQ